MENGFGGLYNQGLYRVKKVASSSRGPQARMVRTSVMNHFILKQKLPTGNKFYLYRGLNFTDKEQGYQLLMMAVHFPEERLARFYAIHDVNGDEQRGLISSDMRFRKENAMRVERSTIVPFDYHNSAQAVLLMNEHTNVDGKKEMHFVIKNRYCSHCTSARSCYHCLTDKPG